MYVFIIIATILAYQAVAGNNNGQGFLSKKDILSFLAVGNLRGRRAQSASG